MGPNASVTHSMVTGGCEVYGKVENSVLFHSVIVEEGAVVRYSILMPGTVVKAGAALSCVIADKGVVVNQNRTLMGHQTYPLAIAKGSVV